MEAQPGSLAIDPGAVEQARERMLSGPAEDHAKRILDSLCDPTRVKIVRALQAGPLAASDIARVIARSRAATSQHLKVLRNVNAVAPTRSGNIVRYRLSEDVSAHVLSDIAESFDRLEETG